ncbi:MAG: hypothetical protein JW809_04595 [Pirellulales bacterium]|nr:hypothetical protein [Pirellulales bacterium]
MLDSSWRGQVISQTRTAQIIVVAMVGGCLAFAAIAVVIRSGDAAPLDCMPVVTYAALAMAGAAVVARLALGVVLRGAFRKGLIAGEAAEPSIDDLHRLLQWLQVRTIAGGALFEGATFFLLIAFLLEGSPLSVGASAILMLGIAWHFPLPGRTAEWVEHELDLAVQERRLGR